MKVKKGEILPGWLYSTYSPLSWFAGGTYSWSAQFCVTQDPPLSGVESVALTVGDTKKV